MQTIIGYVRVSTIEQESGYGREVQEQRIRDYCTDQGLPAPAIIRESKSGESITERQELHTVLSRAEMAREGEHEAHIVFSSLDRLSRDLIDQETVVMRCMKSGVRLHSTQSSENDTLDPAYAGDPMRTAIRQFWGIVHQLDKAIIQRRLDGGLVRKGSQGGFTGGRIPFGYMAVNKELVINPEHAPVVRHLFHLRDAGINLGTIAGVLSATYPDLCGKWQKQQISRCLSRRNLYEHGAFKPRGAKTSVVRDDLIIITDVSTPPPAAQIDWDKVDYPMGLDQLAVLLGEHERTLQDLVSKNSILVSHLGGTRSPRAEKPAVTQIRALIEVSCQN